MREMKKQARLDEAVALSKPARCGRPPLEHAGEVEERILEAAIQVFLERGFEGASIDLIAETARCGKPTIYARHANKEALFAAAVTHRIKLRNARLGSHKPEGATVAERLASIGAAVIKETLTDELVGLMRLAVAEARRFPDLASGVFREARERGVETIAYLLKQGVEGWACPGDGGLETLEAARLFAELILLPFLMRAFFQDIETLRSEVPSFVERRAIFFLAALRNGGLA